MNQIIEQARAQFNQKRVLIFGLGLLGGGEGDARFFAGLGANVTVTDSKSTQELTASIQALNSLPITFHCGGHLEEDVQNTDFIIRNPSVPKEHPMMKLARTLHKPVLMRSSLFATLSGIPIIGVTGTRGKTTTTAMIHQLLTHLTNRQILLTGNIQGVSDLELLSTIDNSKRPLAVMELSSWQLQGFADSRISPHIAVITNLFPDHLNRYDSLSAYYEDKRQIILHQITQDYAVLNASQPEFHYWASTIQSQIQWFDDAQLPPTLHLGLKGKHNYANAAAALAVAKVLNLDPLESIQILNHFEAVPYRLQTIAYKQGVEWINDTTSTTPVATIAALHSFTVPPVTIIGGADKNLPLNDLADALNQHAKSVILLQGSGTDKLKPLIDVNKIAGLVNSMQQAVDLAKSIAHNDDVVLLSPGFASFGMFVNEFDRGNQFNQCVQNLD